MELDAQTYRCECEKGYRGALCNLKAEPSSDSCQGLRCVHGQCQVTEEGERCVCEQGFTGESCDTGEEGQGLSMETASIHKSPLILFRMVVISTSAVKFLL